MAEGRFPNGPAPTNFREAVRYRSEFYVGRKDVIALHHLVHAVVSGLLVEYFRVIQVTILDNLALRFTCTVWETSFGTGEVPITLSGIFGKCDRSGAPSFFISDHNYLPVLNALSSKFEIEICEGGAIQRQLFENGLAASALPTQDAKASDRPDQCIINVILDAEFFGNAQFQFEPLWKELVAIEGGFHEVLIDLRDERTG